MSTKDGGSAFPVVQTTYEGDRGDYRMNVESVGGMQLRDYFAAKALAAMLGNRDKEASSRGRGGLTKFPKYAYEWADAMLKAREQTP